MANVIGDDDVRHNWETVYDSTIKPKEKERKGMEAVDHPKHYNTGKIEVITFIDDQNLGFSLGNCIKYICRAEHKGKRLQDLKKARFYLNHEIEKLEAIFK